MEITRLPEIFVRTEMAKLRPRKNGRVVCDLCGDYATDRHHIITKYHTMHNPQASWYANHPWVTTMLCRECHASADSVSNRERILQRLYIINGKGNALVGYLRVKAIYESASECLVSGILWQLPEPE